MSSVVVNRNKSSRSKKQKKRWHIPRRTKFDGKPAEKSWKNDVIEGTDSKGRVLFDENKNIIGDDDSNNNDTNKLTIPTLQFHNTIGDNNGDDFLSETIALSNDNKYLRKGVIKSARAQLRKCTSSPDFDSMLNSNNNNNNKGKNNDDDDDEEEDAESISDDTTSISSKSSSRSSDDNDNNNNNNNYKNNNDDDDGAVQKKKGQASGTNNNTMMIKKPYMIPPKHDIHKKLIIPKYASIHKGRVITKQIVKRTLLRDRFVALAHHYVGVPYAQKYWKEGTKEHGSSLFLDCCGLVRRILQDMAFDLGFVIGPWNQSYLFDTLPEDISFEKMKPGDLIFYRAKFYNPKKSKAQKHDMVHVEVYLGDKDYKYATIGSRQIEAKVAYHDDYRFNSKYYKVYKHHFKSIDTWLDGTLKSFCKNCSWNWNRKPMRLRTMPRVKPGYALTTSQKKKKQRPKSAGIARRPVNRDAILNRFKREQQVKKQNLETRTTAIPTDDNDKNNKRNNNKALFQSALPPPSRSISSSAKLNDVKVARKYRSIDNNNEKQVAMEEESDYEKVQISNISLSKLGLGINVDFSVGLKKKKNSNNMNKEIGKYHKNSVMNDSKMKKWRRRNEDKNPFDSSEPSFSEFVTRKKKTNYRNNRMTSSLAAKKTKKSKKIPSTSLQMNRLSKKMNTIQGRKKKSSGAYYKRMYK